MSIRPWLLPSVVLTIPLVLYAQEDPRPPKRNAREATPIVRRLKLSGGALIVQRTADSPVGRGEPQRWILLWEDGKSGEVYVWDGVAEDLDSAVAGVESAGRRFGFRAWEVLDSAEWDSLTRLAWWSESGGDADGLNDSAGQNKGATESSGGMEGPGEWPADHEGVNEAGDEDGVNELAGGMGGGNDSGGAEVGAAEVGEKTGEWRLATVGVVLELLGLPEWAAAIEGEQAAATLALPCVPNEDGCRCTVLALRWATAAVGDPCSSGPSSPPPPPPPPPDPCEGSTDPCCVSTDPCCGNLNRCCDPSNACCASVDPCCEPASPCCGNPDRCCNPDNPCCGSSDPCCNPDNPCCGIGGPCCDDPDPCCNDPDPCCGVDCDDGNVCTRDLCDDGSCVHVPMGGPCADDGNECTEDVCSGGSCVHPPRSGGCTDDGDPCTLDVCEFAECVHEPTSGPACADDGNECTWDVCAEGICTHPCKADCTACQNGWCVGCACALETCSIGVSDGETCPGRSAELIVSGACLPACSGNVSWTISSVSLHISGTSGTVVCGGKSVPTSVGVSPDAPLGMIPITITGTTPRGGQCVQSAAINVILEAAITVDPASIGAMTDCSGENYNSSSEVTVDWDPPDCEGRLEIVEVDPIAGYVPPGEGSLTRLNANLWRYNAFIEPKNELHPANVRVWIAAMTGTQELARQSVLVRNVFAWWVSGHQHRPGLAMHTPDVGDYLDAYIFARCKYSQCRPPAGEFTTVSVDATAQVVSCRIGWFTWVDAAACTDADNNVVFALSAFTQGENTCASIIGHELLHTTGADECGALTWELNNQTCTGIHGTYLQKVQEDKVMVCGE